MNPLPALRHLKYAPDARIDDIGPAGLQAILDGGDVADWRPILAAIGRDPWGPLADRVERLLPHLETYGTAAALERWLHGCRGSAERRPVRLAELRAARGLSQRQVAAQMGVSQPQVARIETSANPTLRSLRRYLAVLGLKPFALVATSGTDASAIRLQP